MTKKFLKSTIAFLLVLLLVATPFITPSTSVKAGTAAGAYVVKAYNVKSVSLKGKTLKLTTSKQKQLALVTLGKIKNIKAKTTNFKLKDTNIMYSTNCGGDSVEQIKISGLKKLIKNSKQHTQDYIDGGVTMVKPEITIYVDADGIVTNIIFSQGELD